MVEEFTRVLQSLAQSCKFGAPKNELTRNQLVLGIRDRHLSEHLQQDAELALEKAISMGQNSEVVKGQQSLICRKEAVLRITWDVVVSTKYKSADILTYSGPATG